MNTPTSLNPQFLKLMEYAERERKTQNKIYSTDNSKRHPLALREEVEKLILEKGVTPADVDQVVKWNSETIVEMLHPIKDSLIIPNQDFLYMMGGIFRALYLKKEFEKKFPEAQISFNPNLILETCYEQNDDWILVNGVEGKKFIQQNAHLQ